MEEDDDLFITPRRWISYEEFRFLREAGVSLGLCYETMKICNLNPEYKSMAYPKDIPNPTCEYPDFISKIMALDEPLNLQHFRDAAGKDRRLWMIESAMKCSMAVRDGLLKPELIDNGGETINSFVPVPTAKEFWKNGCEEKIPVEEILNGWKAMQSIIKDGKTE